ncbi:MAG: T9SS type A sorting domain-containing protein [Chitinophagaceae bacterium]|nr:T9SS type A sorting domain-containing protein [Chitinophagaceae bacterium]MCB9055762.1 T9SS type A sorting domain-containing protein [Chitinophagales bacterium]
MRKGIISVIFLFFSIIVTAQYSLTGPSYTQDFDAFGTSSYNGITGGSLNNVNVLLNGWYFIESGTNANFDITFGTGSNNAGDSYNFGLTADPDRTLGGLQSGSLNPTFGFWFTNNSGAPINALLIAYTGEQWRLGTTGRVDQLDFQYSLNATTLNNGTWTNFNPLDFTAPVTTGATGALNGNAAPNRTNVSSTITGLNIPVGATFFIRWTDFNATGADDGLGIDDFDLTIVPSIPASSDYYRSVQTGDWSDPATWESSPDNINWTVAGVAPTSAADTILIQNGDTVTIDGNTSADQLFIQNGGVLIYSSITFTVDDGVGDDITIENGGIFVLEIASTPPTFGAGNPTINVLTGGTLRVESTGMTAAGAGVNADNFIYQDQSVLEYTPSSPFSSSGVTFFPNADAFTIPIFRTTSNIGFVGGNDSTVINGVFEANGNITFEGDSHKYFRNGITGTGNVIISSSTGRKFIINGITAELGGTGVINVNSMGSGGLEIGGSPSGNITTVTSDKTINGFVSLLNTGPGTYVQLDTSDLTIAGGTSGGVIIPFGSTSTYIRTNGSGRLIQNNITGSRTFPIGHTSYNPVFIAGGGGDNYAARVDTGIAPSIAFPTYGINRTWNIQSLAAMPSVGVTVTYQFATADANPNVVPPEALEILMNDGIAWSIIPGNDSIVPTGTDPYQITTTSALTVNSATETPYCLGKKGGWILPLDCIVECRSQKQNNTGLISFEVNSCAEVNSFEIQRSSGGRPFETISEVPPDITKNRFSYSDADLQPGINLYRIKVNRLSGSIKYSNTTAIINDTKGWVITGVYPSPASDMVKLAISSAKTESLQVQIYNMSGNILKQWQQNITAGSNIIETDIQQLPTGVYVFTVNENGIKKSVRFIKN